MGGQTNYGVCGRELASQDLSHLEDESCGNEDVVMDMCAFQDIEDKVGVASVEDKMGKQVLNGSDM